MTRNKYNNKITYEDGLCFRSLLEKQRYRELKLLLHAGAIRDLKIHTRWKLAVGDVLIATYEDDFNYVDAQGRLVVEDVKSEATVTPLYKMKAKLMKAVHNIDVIEVY
jgi:Protein of unknown function (DUF1064)